ncbi:MAG: TIM barrel protein [Acidobacteriota bacterium]|nr:TIM barrel protein [Acidobacteriota bacterium]
MTRREFLPALAASAAVASAQAPARLDPKPPSAFELKPKHGRIKQSVCSSVFKKGTPFEEQCRLAAELGFQGFDLQTPEQWPVLKKYGLVSAMTQGGGGKLTDALNEKANHAAIETEMRATIDKCAESGSPNLITFSGNRHGISDEQGMDNCVLFLNKVKSQAEDKNVNVCMELLNSRVNHKDYQCDHVDWGVEVCKRVNSPRVKLLFDIYHMQIMDGDIARRIQQNFQWMGHFHTGGVPGRHEIDNDSQELNYHFVAKAIADLGYRGFVAHEYSPVRDPMTSLKEAREIFTV